VGKNGKLLYIYIHLYASWRKLRKLDELKSNDDIERDRKRKHKHKHNMGVLTW
jgi:hypothetical protein